jgi:hypothetical protein
LSLDDSFKRGSTLPLLVTRVGADHAHHPLAADDLAFATNLLY